jgi:hypothetical protein
MRYLRSTLFAVIFTALTRCAGAADDSVTGTLADVVQNVGSMTMMQVRDLALEQAMEIKPIKYKSTQLETATFTGTYTPTESDRFLVMFSDDGYKITVKLGGEEVFKQDALNRGQHLPNVDGNPSATRSLHLLPIVLEKGVTYEIEVVYRNKFYYGATDIDGITVFVVDSATEFEMCSAVCTPAGGMKPTTAVGDPHDVHIRARVDTDGRTRTYKVTFRAHNPPNGLVRVDDIEVEDLDGGLPILFFQKGTLNNHATFSVSSQVLPGAPNMLTKRLQVTVHFKGVNPGSVTLSFYDKRTERATDVGWELLRDNTTIPGDERKTWLVGTGEVAAVANAGVAVSGARAYLPRGGGTVEVVVKADLGAGVAHNVITEWPKDHNNNQWPTCVRSPLVAGTLTTVVNGHGTASTIFGANPEFVGEATLIWKTGTSTNVATVTVLPIEFVIDANNNQQVDPTDPSIGFVRFGLWDNAYDAAGDIRNGVAEADNFVGSDRRRFYLRVTNPAANTNPAVAEEITVDWFTTQSDGTDDDHPAISTVTLVETGPNTGVFASRAVMLVVNNLDLAQVTNTGLAAHPGTPGPGAADHRTRRGRIDGNTRILYRPLGAGAGLPELTQTATIFNRNPDERRRLALRVVNYSDPATGAPYATAAYIAGQIAHAQDLWTQAGLQIDAAPTVVRQIPAAALNAAGEYPGSADSDEEVAVLDDLIPITPDNTLTVVFVRRPAGRNAYTTVFQRIRSALGDRFFIFIDSGLNLNNETLGHEFFHALYNRGDVDVPRQFFTFNTNPPVETYGIPLPDVRVYRRIHRETIAGPDPNEVGPFQHGYKDWVRKVRTTRFPIGAGILPETDSTGNTLVAPY